MLYHRDTDTPAADVLTELHAAAEVEGFSVLTHYDFRDILRSKGFDFDQPCSVVELCRASAAARALAGAPDLAVVLPCRIAVYGADGHTRIAMIPPGEMAALVGEAPADLTELLGGVEAGIRRVIDRCVNAGAVA